MKSTKKIVVVTNSNNGGIVRHLVEADDYENKYNGDIERFKKYYYSIYQQLDGDVFNVFEDYTLAIMFVKEYNKTR